MVIETLVTPRLRLVAPMESHLDAYAKLVGDAVFMAHLEQGPMSRDDAHRNLASILGHWQLRGWGNWLVEDHAGELVGRVGINDWTGWPEPELGWWTAPTSWGKGYAGEAARAVLDWAAKRGRARLISLIRHANVASQRVAEKLGAVRERDIDFHGGPARVYAHTVSPAKTYGT